MPRASSVLSHAPLVRLVRRRRLSCLLSHRRLPFASSVVFSSFPRRAPLAGLAVAPVPVCDICRLQTADCRLADYISCYLYEYILYIPIPIYLYLYEALVWLTQARVCKSAVCICRTALLFSLAPTRAFPSTDRPNDATTASLLAPPEVFFLLPTCITCFTHAFIIPPTCSTRWARSRSPLQGRVRRPSFLTTQRRRRYSRPQRFPPCPRRALLA